MSVRILATGAYLPGGPIDNAQLEKLCGPLPDDVLAGIGVQRRHWLADPLTGEHTTTNSRMAAEAARIALSRAELTPSDVDLIVLSTASPEHHLPTTASYVQEHLGMAGGAAIELRAGCAGAVQALDIARRYLVDGSCRTALVIGSEVISPLLVPLYLGRESHQVRMRDRLNLYNFGDGAAALVLQAGDPGTGYAYATGTLGAQRKPGMLVVDGGIRLDAAGVAALGPKVFATALRELLDRAGLQLADVDACVLPEGNAGYFSDDLEAAVHGKIVENLADVGATGSPAVLLALDAAVAAGRVRRGDTVLLIAIEASRYVYAGAAMRW